MSKINVIACGGAGISVADKVVNNIAELGEGFASIDITYMDTSKNNIDKVEHNPNSFWLVKSKSFGGSEISGSGSMRTKNVSDISENVKEFLDTHKFTVPVTGEYIVVISSASGGKLVA